MIAKEAVSRCLPTIIVSGDNDSGPLFKTKKPPVSDVLGCDIR